MRNSNRLKRRRYKEGISIFSFGKFEAWCTWVVKHPQMSIILPLMITIFFSYPFLSILEDPRNAFVNSLNNNYVSKMEIIDSSESSLFESSLDLSLLQIWVKPLEETNVLKKKTLLESLAFQTRLLKDIPGLAIIDSPFKIWDHSLENLKNDPSPLSTINSNVLMIPHYSFFGTWKINGVISSATGIVISLLVNKEDYSNLNVSLNKNINQLNEISNITNFHILPVTDSTKFTEIDEILRCSLISSTCWDNGIFIILVLLFTAYCILFMLKLKNSVKSVIGISTAMASHLLLAIISSSTITNIFFKDSDDNLPYHFLYLPVLMVLVNEQLRAIRDVSGCFLNSNSALKNTDTEGLKNVSDAYDHSHDQNFISSLAMSHYRATKCVISLSLLILFVVPFSRRATCFLITAIWIGHFLQCGFFSAVLSLDFRRFDNDNVLTAKVSKSEIFLDKEVIHNLEDKKYFKNWYSYNNLCSIGYSIAFCILYLIFFNSRFHMARTSTSLFYKVFSLNAFSILPLKRPVPKAVFDHRLISDLIFDPASKEYFQSTVQLILSVSTPIFVLQWGKGRQNHEVKNSQLVSLFDSSSFTSSYKIDFYYAFEFILFVSLAISCTLLLLQRLMVKLDSISGLKTPHSQQRMLVEEIKEEKEGKDGLNSTKDESLDTKEVTDQFHTKELYKQGHTLDITNITDSKSPFVVSMGLDYKVYVWSPLVKPIPPPTPIPLHRKFWPLSKVIISNDGYYIAFFSKHGNITTWSRRHMSFIWELQLKQNSAKNNAVPLEAFFRRITVPSFKRKTSLAAASKQAFKNSHMSINTLDFISMTSLGGIDTSYEHAKRKSNDEEDNEELVFLTAAGLIYSIDSKAKICVDNLQSSPHPLISCKKLSSPRVNDRLIICDQAGDLFVSTVVNNKWRTRKLVINYKNVITPPEKFCKIRSNPPIAAAGSITLETDNIIELVPFVGMLVRVTGTVAELIDAQTGTLIRTFSLGHFKVNSLQVFHDTPTHCRFCGSASVASFSIAYTEAECSRVVLHTFQLESRTKTSICLRVERDPREIRCLGMESAVETIHYFYNAENWCVTDNNMLVGIRKVPENIVDRIGSSSMSTNSSDESMSLLNRRNRVTDPCPVDSNSFKIHNIWEGFTMTASGTVMLHKIPVGVNGLIVNKIGPLVRFGSKAMIVAFANIMNMFYVGHEDMLFTTENDGANHEESSLKFVNKRRDRFSHRKVPINYET